MTLTYGEALQVIGGLSRPSKMPWWSWSISASNCITGSKLRKVPGSTCSSCYALKGFYRFPVVAAAHERRQLALDHTDFVEAFTIVLHYLHAKTKKRRLDGDLENRFRWLDAGDLQSVDMLIKINQIAINTPKINHWLPTREYEIVGRYLADGGTFAPNLVVRLSAAMVDDEPLRQPFGQSYSVVGCSESTKVHHCQASASQGNECLECDKCWKRGNISYPLH